MVRWSTSFIVFMYNLIDPCQYDSDLCYLIGSDGSERSIQVRDRYEYGLVISDITILCSRFSRHSSAIDWMDGRGWLMIVSQSSAQQYSLKFLAPYGRDDGKILILYVYDIYPLPSVHLLKQTITGLGLAVTCAMRSLELPLASIVPT